MEISNVKQEDQPMVESLPDKATRDDLTYTIYVRKAVKSGLEDSDAGRGLDVGEVRAKLGSAKKPGQSGSTRFSFD